MKRNASVAFDREKILTKYCKDSLAINPKKVFKTLQIQARDSFIERNGKIYLPLLHQAARNKTYQFQRTSGDEIMAAMNQTFNEGTFGFKPTDQQKIFFQEMLKACVPIIYKDDLSIHLDRILSQNNWTEIKQELLCVTPRRFGKTWAVGMFIAALLINVPEIEIVVFSMAMRASRKMLALVDKFISRHEKGASMICRPHNQERLTLKGDSPNDERMCLSLPGRSDVFYIYFFYFYLFRCSLILNLIIIIIITIRIIIITIVTRIKHKYTRVITLPTDNIPVYIQIRFLYS